MSSPKGWIAVDLDRTLAYYDFWRGPSHIGDPTPLMAERVRGWLAEGRDVRIFTARVSRPAFPMGDSFTREERRKALDRIAQAELARRAINRWTEQHFGVRLPITCEKDYDMEELWDDRAVQVLPNHGQRVGT